MNLKRWLFLFVSTLAVGAVSSLLFGFIIEQNLWGKGLANFFIGFIGHLGAGMLFSLIAQMGFFAYLAVHSFGLGVFRSLWSGVQVILIGFTLFDLIYFRSVLFNEGAMISGYLWYPVGILLFAIIIAYFKVKQTNSRAAVPTIFVLFTVTIIEWIPALRSTNTKSMLYMLIPLLLCNAWQVMLLHHLTKKAPENRKL